MVLKTGSGNALPAHKGFPRRCGPRSPGGFFSGMCEEHRRSHHPEIAKPEWTRLMKKNHPGLSDRKGFAAGCRQRALLKRSLEEVKQPRFPGMQAFVWPIPKFVAAQGCKNKAGQKRKIKRLSLQHAWKCHKCGEVTRQLSTARKHSKGPCPPLARAEVTHKRRKQQIDLMWDWVKANAASLPEHQVLTAALQGASEAMQCPHHVNIFIRALTANLCRTGISKTPIVDAFAVEHSFDLLSLQEIDINSLSAPGYVAGWRHKGYTALLSPLDCTAQSHRVALISRVPCRPVKLEGVQAHSRIAAGLIEVKWRGQLEHVLVLALYGFPGDEAATDVLFQGSLAGYRPFWRLVSGHRRF